MNATIIHATVTCPACGGSAWDSKGNACGTCGCNGTVNR